MGGGTSLSWKNGDGDIDIALPYSRAKISLSPYGYNIITTPRVKYNESETTKLVSLNTNPVLNAKSIGKTANPCKIEAEAYAVIPTFSGVYNTEKIIRYRYEEIRPNQQLITSDYGSVTIYGKTYSTNRYEDDKESGAPFTREVTDANITAYLEMGDRSGQGQTLVFDPGKHIYEGNVYFYLQSSACDLTVGSLMVHATVRAGDTTRRLAVGI